MTGLGSRNFTSLPLRPLRDLIGGDWGYVGSSGGTGGDAGRLKFLPLGVSETGVVNWGTSVQDRRGIPDPSKDKGSCEVLPFAPRFARRSASSLPGTPA